MVIDNVKKLKMSWWRMSPPAFEDQILDETDAKITGKVLTMKHVLVLTKLASMQKHDD